MGAGASHSLVQSTECQYLLSRGSVCVFHMMCVLLQNVINPYPTAMESTKTITLQASNVSSQPKLKLSIDFQRPPHITKCG